MRHPDGILGIIKIADGPRFQPKQVFSKTKTVAHMAIGGSLKKQLGLLVRSHK